MSGIHSSDGKQRPAQGDAHGGGTGEGSNSALEAMLKKRRMDVHPPALSGPPGPPGPQQQDGGKGRE